MEIKRKVAVEEAGRTEADWSAGQVSTLTVPDFTTDEIEYLNQAETDEAETSAEPSTRASGDTAMAGPHPIVRAGNQIAGFLLRR
ncbi:MAG TPA: hypothetical protein VF245_07320 [Solirubrobacterales bacterium]